MNCGLTEAITKGNENTVETRRVSVVIRCRLSIEVGHLLSAEVAHRGDRVHPKIHDEKSNGSQDLRYASPLYKQTGEQDRREKQHAHATVSSR